MQSYGGVEQRNCAHAAARTMHVALPELACTGQSVIWRVTRGVNDDRYLSCKARPPNCGPVTAAGYRDSRATRGASVASETRNREVCYLAKTGEMRSPNRHTNLIARRYGCDVTLCLL